MFFHEFAIKTPSGSRVTWRLQGTGGSTPKMTHSHCCWLEALVLHHISPILRLDWWHDKSSWHIWLPTVPAIQEHELAATLSFIIQPQKSHPSLSAKPYWLHKSALFLVGKDTNNRINIGGTWGLATIGRYYSRCNDSNVFRALLCHWVTMWHFCYETVKQYHPNLEKSAMHILEMIEASLM